MAKAYNWLAIEPRYKAGETPEQLAAAFKVKASTISEKASREGWVQQKQEIRKAVTESLPQAIVSKMVAEAADYVTQHLDDWQTIRNAVMDVIENEKDPIERVKLAIAGFKAMAEVQKGQRVSLGLDKPDPPSNQQSGMTGIALIPAKQPLPEFEYDTDDSMAAEPRPPVQGA